MLREVLRKYLKKNWKLVFEAKAGSLIYYNANRKLLE
jgi:hypothetical protein